MVVFPVSRGSNCLVRPIFTLPGKQRPLVIVIIMRCKGGSKTDTSELYIWRRIWVNGRSNKHKNLTQEINSELFYVTLLLHNIFFT